MTPRSRIHRLSVSSGTTSPALVLSPLTLLVRPVLLEGPFTALLTVRLQSLGNLLTISLRVAPA